MPSRTMSDCEEMIAAFEQIEGDDQISCVIVTGSGSAFCAGGDIKAMKGPHGRWRKRDSHCHPR